MGKVFYILIFLLFTQEVFAGCPTPPVYCRGRELVKHARLVFRTQPTLYRSEEFSEFQDWTLFYQFGKRRHTQIYMLLVQNPAMSSSLPSFRGHFEKLAESTAQLIGELPENLHLHYSMNSKENRSYWADKLYHNLSTMLLYPDQYVGDFEDYFQHDCDYLSQPLNMLWFYLNALHLMNSIGEEEHKEAWSSNLTEKQKELLSFDPMSLYFL